jgi:hypothetical protein
MKHKLIGFIESREVYLDGKQLHPEKSQKIINHSPDGFSWGYNGSGPAQLALAILLEITSTEKALRNYQDLKNQIIAELPQTDFETTFDFKAI